MSTDTKDQELTDKETEDVQAGKIPRRIEHHERQRWNVQALGR